MKIRAVLMIKKHTFRYSTIFDSMYKIFDDTVTIGEIIGWAKSINQRLNISDIEFSEVEE